MARFTNVHVFPYSGWPEWSWGLLEEDEDTDATLDVDAFARGSRRITEALSVALIDEGLEAKSSSLRVFADAAGAHSRDLEVSVRDFGGDGYYSAGVEIPTGFRHHSPAIRDRLVADCVYLALRQLSQFLEWDEAALDTAIAVVEASGFECTWVSAWKSTRDRRRRVRLRAFIADDGYARLRVEVAGRDSDDPIVVTEEMLGWTWIENLERTAKSMKWSAPTTLMLDNHGAAVTIAIDTGTVRRGQPDRKPRQIVSVAELAPSVPSVVLERPGQRVWLGGGGPMSAATEPYVAAADVFHSRMNSRPDWTAWFARLDIDEFFAPMSFGTSVDKVSVRLVRRRLSATRYRTAATLPGRSDAERVARADLELLLERVRSRLGAPPHPPLD